MPELDVLFKVLNARSNSTVLFGLFASLAIKQCCSRLLLTINSVKPGELSNYKAREVNVMDMFDLYRVVCDVTEFSVAAFFASSKSLSTQGYLITNPYH